jgi:hypothetical protein
LTSISARHRSAAKAPFFGSSLRAFSCATTAPASSLRFSATRPRRFQASAKSGFSLVAYSSAV